VVAKHPFVKDSKYLVNCNNWDKSLRSENPYSSSINWSKHPLQQSPRASEEEEGSGARNPRSCKIWSKLQAEV
jgi:hypothetical protein